MTERLWMVLLAMAAAGGVFSRFAAWRRWRRECCDCCTCEICQEVMSFDAVAPAAPSGQIESVPRPDAEPTSPDVAGTAELVPGHTIYAELTALTAADDVAAVLEAEAAYDPDWHQGRLARSEAWLAEWRATLGLVA